MSSAEKIKKNIIFLKENIDTRELLDLFIQEDLFTFNNAEEVNAQTTSNGKTGKFLEMVSKLGDKGYNLLRTALQDLGREDVVTQLDNTEIDEPVNRFDQLTDDEKKIKITERELMRFNKITPTEMDILAVAMGFTETDSKVIKMENPYSVPNQFAKLWIKWRNFYSKKATLGLLTTHLIEAEAGGASVDWSIYDKAKEFLIANNTRMDT